MWWFTEPCTETNQELIRSHWALSAEISLHKKELISMLASELWAAKLLMWRGEVLSFIWFSMFLFYQTANHNQGLLMFLKVSFSLWNLSHEFSQLACDVKGHVPKLPGMSDPSGVRNRSARGQTWSLFFEPKSIKMQVASVWMPDLPPMMKDTAVNPHLKVIQQKVLVAE